MKTLAASIESGKEIRPLRFHWGSGAFFAVLDQGLFAGSNFLANILLARWLSPESYGAFTVAYSVLVLVGTVYSEVLTAPLLVFGVGKYAEDFHEYLGWLLLGHFALTIVMSSLIALVAMFLQLLGSTLLAHGLFGVAIAAPLVFLLWLTRSAFYARLEPQYAAAGGGLYLLIFLAGFYGLFRAHYLGLISALGVLGFASVAVGGLLLIRLRPAWSEAWPVLLFRFVRSHLARRGSGGSASTWAPDAERRRDRWRPMEAVSDHIRYGRWSLAASLAGWVGGNAHYFVLSSVAGLGATAVMRILDTALLPFYHYQLALSKVFVPLLGARLRDTRSDPWTYVLRMASLWGAQACGMYLFLRLFAGRILPWLYGDAYANQSALLAWYGLILIPDALVTVVLSLFRASVRTDLIFQYYVIFSLSLLVAFLAVARHGPSGIVMARVVLSTLIVPAALLVARNVCAGTNGS